MEEVKVTIPQQPPRQHTTGKVDASGSGCFFDIVLLDETREVYFGLVMCQHISVAVVTGSRVATRCRETGEDSVSANSRRVEFNIRYRLFIIRQTCFHLHICTLMSFQRKNTSSERKKPKLFCKFDDFSP